MTMRMVQVECVYAETDVELQKRINNICETLAFNGDDVINVSYAIHSGRVFPMYAMVVYKTDISR